MGWMDMLGPGGVGAESLFNFFNMQESERAAREAQREAIARADTAAGQVGDAGTRLANMYLHGGTETVPGGKDGEEQTISTKGAKGLIADAYGSARGDVDRWYQDWEKRGGMEGQVRPEAEGHAATVDADTQAVEKKAEKERQDTLDRLRQERAVDYQRVNANLQDFVARHDAGMENINQKYDDMLQSHEDEISAARADTEALKTYLNKGVGNQVAGAMGEVESNKTQALAQFDASWQGPRDQRYTAARRAIEQQFSAQGHQLRGQMLGSHNQLMAGVMQAAYASVNTLVGTTVDAAGQAYYGLTQATAEGTTALRGAYGDVSDFLASTFGDIAATERSTYSDLTAVQRTGMELRTGASEFATGQITDAIRMDEGTRFARMQAGVALTEAELAANSQAEATYMDMLYATMDRMSGWAQFATEMTFGQNFGTPQLTAFQDTWATLREVRMDEAQREYYDDMASAANTQNWISGAAAVASPFNVNVGGGD